MARSPVVGDLGRFVHVSADAMADILAHDGEAVRLHIRLHGVGDVGDAVALAGLRKSFKKALTSHVDQPLCLFGNFSAGVSGCAVAVEAADVCAHVHTDDIALLEHPGTRDAVDDLVIDGHAHAGGIAVVV